MPKTRLVVLYGGRSAEHDVSCVSARFVMGAIDQARYDVRSIGITRQGQWLAVDSAIAELPADARSLPSPDGLVGVVPEVEPMEVLAGSEGASVVVLPIFHGPMGEDGSMQGLLEVAGVPYVGAGVLASALCMDKGVAKDVLAARGIPQLRWVCRREQDLSDADTVEIVAELGLPLFVKPANMGSSVGVSRATAVEQLQDAIALARTYDEYVIIEEALLRPREIEIAVLGNVEARVSLPGEVAPSHEFYDFDDKYLARAAGLLIPANLGPDEIAAAQALALAAYRALRVDGFARVDLFYEPEGRGFLVNEVNTIPGCTPDSLFPQLWAAAGLSPSALIDEFVRLALERHERRSAFATTR